MGSRDVHDRFLRIGKAGWKPQSTPERREHSKARRDPRGSLADPQNTVNHPGPHAHGEAWLREAVAQERADVEALRRALGAAPKAARSRKR